MSKTLRNVGFAALLAISASALMPGQASALSMAECSAKYKAAKAAGTDAGLKWNDFRKAQCSTDASAAAPAAPAPAPAAPVKPAKAAKAVAPAAPAVAAAPATTPSGSFMKDCAASWKSMKAANSVPAGMTWKDFVAGKCQVAAAPAAPAAASTGNFMKDCSTSWKAMQAAGTVPAGMAWKDFVAAKCVVAGTPAATPAVATKAPKASVAPPEPTQDDNTPAATTDKNGKPYTPGQIAAHARIKQCGNQWRALKAQGKTPVGMMWPQYWSACNKQLKAKGQ